MKLELSKKFLETFWITRLRKVLARRTFSRNVEISSVCMFSAVKQCIAIKGVHRIGLEVPNPIIGKF